MYWQEWWDNESHNNLLTFVCSTSKYLQSKNKKGKCPKRLKAKVPRCIYVVFFYTHHFQQMFGKSLMCCSVVWPCQERSCGRRGLWRVQRADTPWACSCRCCNQTCPCPACPGPSSSPTGRLGAERRKVDLLYYKTKQRNILCHKMQWSFCSFYVFDLQ